MSSGLSNCRPIFVKDGLHQGYVHAVIEGLANHLGFRFGNFRPGNQWEPVIPLPEGKILALTLLNCLERYSILWQNEKIVSQALEACCAVLDDPEAAERITLLLFWIRYKAPDDEDSLTLTSGKELASRAINSARGIAAKSAIKLCNRLLEQDQPLPKLLPYLLHHFARDSAIHTRVPILEQLPFLMYKRPDLGWQLLADVFQEPQLLLWKYVERCLYYQYRVQFDQVAPYLARLKLEGMDEAGDAWGRISALASLAGYINQEVLFDILMSANISAWKGAAQIFTANLSRREHTAVCHSGLITILGYENLSDEVVRAIENCFEEEANRGLIQHELALAFLNALSLCASSHDIHDFLEWLSYEARRDPLFALNVAELLAEKLETEMRSHRIWHTQPLITALNEILREADETDDPLLIQRAINLQDCFLRLDIQGIEELFTQAGQH